MFLIKYTKRTHTLPIENDIATGTSNTVSDSSKSKKEKALEAAREEVNNSLSKIAGLRGNLSSSEVEASSVLTADGYQTFKSKVQKAALQNYLDQKSNVQKAALQNYLDQKRIQLNVNNAKNGKFGFSKSFPEPKNNFHFGDDQGPDYKFEEEKRLQYIDDSSSILGAHHKKNFEKEFNIAKQQIIMLENAGVTARMPNHYFSENGELPSMFEYRDALVKEAKKMDPEKRAELGLVDEILLDGSEIEQQKRAIGGDTAFLEGIRDEIMAKASENKIAIYRSEITLNNFGMLLAAVSDTKKNLGKT